MTDETDETIYTAVEISASECLFLMTALSYQLTEALENYKYSSGYIKNLATRLEYFSRGLT